MAISLQNYYTDLVKIRKYLIKIGPTRRHKSKNICAKKFYEASDLVKKFQTDLDTINFNLETYNPEELTLISTLCENVNLIFEDIKKLCVCKDSSDISSDSSEPEDSNLSLDSDSENIVTMEQFDLKTAVSLLPIMNDKEEVTKQLISAIEMYDSILDEKSKKTLIMFVLKTRLSDGAKLRLSQNYGTVKDLISDMHKHLLVKKSFTAIQQQLLRATQNQRSIEVYGKEIENLCVELTISQSDGDSNKFEILKPLNEKLAIKTFTNGLRNGHISTIISARNYSSLREAIRAAKDEELSMPSDVAIMSFTRGGSRQYTYPHRGRGRVFNNSRFPNNNRGNYSTGRGFTGPTRGPPNYNTRYTASYSGRPNHRGISFRSSNRPHNFSRRNHQVNYITSNDSSTPVDNVDQERNEQQNAIPETQFFRSLS